MWLTFHPNSHNFLKFYSKNGSKWLGGIKNEYHDPCQDWLDLINKKLTSPNYSPFMTQGQRPNYDPRTVCQWNLTTDKGYHISLDFERIGVSGGLNFILTPSKMKLSRKLKIFFTL